MRRLALLLLPAALMAGEPRYARLGDFEGTVEVQLHAADPWMPAERNLPLTDLSWVRTGTGARAEIELDDGSVWRLGPDSQGELSDYSRLSTGQRLTLLSLDHGLAYFSGKPAPNDSLSVVLPGAQALVAKAVRLRLEAQPEWSQIAVLEGSARFSSPAAEIELAQGLCARVEPAARDHFYLERKIAPLDLDAWSAGRDHARSATTSQQHVLERYGLADLDAAGTWVYTEQFGSVWKPKAAADWIPFQKGRWRWYDTLGYTWVSDETWGWLPYHYGRWAVSKELGWVWAPSVNTTFKPGDVFWLYGARLAGWGPLAPGEQWIHEGTPQLFANAYTTYAPHAPDARVVDPTGFTARPDEPLRIAVFAAALPSPSFPSARLDALRPALKAGSTRLKPVVTGVTYGTDAEPPQDSSQGNEAAPAQPIVLVVNPAASAPAAAEPDPGVVAYPVPVLEGILAITPPQQPPALSPPKTASAAPAAPPAANLPTGTGRASTTRPPATKSGAAPPSDTGKPERPHSGGERNARARELELYTDVLQHGNDPAALLASLDAWSQEFPRTPYADERTALYVEAYAASKPPQPAKALELGSQLMGRNLQSVFPDPQRGPTLILSVLYSMTLSAWNLPQRTSQQEKAALAASQELLRYTAVFFASARKPANVTAEAWSQARAAVETTARQTAALLGGSDRERTRTPAGHGFHNQ